MPHDNKLHYQEHQPDKQQCNLANSRARLGLN